MDVATRLQAGQPISTQDAQRYNIARSQAGQPTTSFRNGVLVTTPGLSPEALSRLPTTEQVFNAVGAGGGGQQLQSPPFSLPSQGGPTPAGGFSTTDFLPGGAGAGPAPTAPPTPLGAQPQVAPPAPVPVQPQVAPQVAPQPPVETVQVNGSGQDIADAPVEIIPNLPQPRFMNIPTGDGTTVRQIDPAFGKQRELEQAGISKRGADLEESRGALGSVRQLFSLSKTTDTGKFEQFTLPIRAILAAVPNALPEGFNFNLVDTDKVARQQMFDALQTRMVPINRAGTPGQVSNIDFQAYKEASSSLGNLPYANVLLAGGLLQQRARTEALQTFVAKAVLSNPGLTSTEAAKIFERKHEDALRNHPSGGFIVTAKGGTTMPMLNAQMENGEMQSYTGGRAAYDSLEPDTLFRGADNQLYMKGSKHTDPFRADYTGKR